MCGGGDLESVRIMKCLGGRSGGLHSLDLDERVGDAQRQGSSQVNQDEGIHAGQEDTAQTGDDPTHAIKNTQTHARTHTHKHTKVNIVN